MITSYANFKNSNITLLTNALIYDYDMADAGFNVIKQHNLLSNEIIEQLDRMPKQIRNIQVGNLQNEIPNLKTDLTELLKAYNEEFITANGLEEKDILRITRDSVTTVNKVCTKQIFGNIFFNKKETYNFFMEVNGIYIFYNILTDDLIIKNMGEEDMYHEAYKKFFIKIFKYLNKKDKDGLFAFLDDFIKSYRNRTLPIEYYMEFNSTPAYILDGIAYTQLDEMQKDKVQIEYNYMNLLRPILSMLF